MKISANLNNFNNSNKNINKPGFGTLYYQNICKLDPDAQKRFKEKVAELEMEYPGIDCYIETEKEEDTLTLYSGNFKFVEKSKQPLHIAVKKQDFWDRLFKEKPEKSVILPKNLYSVTRSINGDSMDRLLNAENDYEVTPEKVFTNLYAIVENGYKRLVRCKEIGEEFAMNNPNISRTEVVDMAKNVEALEYKNSGSHL